MSKTEQYKIGELALRMDLNQRTIRYYEKIKLLPKPQRTRSGYRLYGPLDEARLRFILRAKQIGLSLEEIREILALRDEGQRPCRHVLALVGRKLAAIDEQLRVLQDLRHELSSLKDGAAKALRTEGNVCSLIEGRHTHDS